MADRCCQCQKTGVCKSCSCVKEGRICTNCYPLRDNHCYNQPPASNSVLSSSSDEDLDTHVDVSHCDSDSVPSLSHSPQWSVTGASTMMTPASDEVPLSQQELDSLMIEAYGPDALCTTTPNCNSDWRSRWLSVTQLSGSHYSLPRGPIGRRYVSLLTDEIKFLAQKQHSSERLILFTSVMLQRDKMVKKAGDIKRIIDKRLFMWLREDFDVLVQGAIRCDRHFQLSTKNKHLSPDHITKVFTRLIFQGKVRAAMRWLSGESRGNMLRPDDFVKQRLDDVCSTISVIDALKLKHPSPRLPFRSSLLLDSSLPPLEDIDITGAHIQGRI
uniref:Tesmin/TSO1-like CXC domain-containing protein n=1 Tax=Amphimedon queenslandica TaxID=400682 RepID=A0A1X7UF79_AMPQE